MPMVPPPRAGEGLSQAPYPARELGDGGQFHEAGVALGRVGGRVALLYAYELELDFQHFASVGRLMEREAMTEAESIINRHALDITRESGRVPEIFVRKGTSREELFKLVKEHPEISVLVLAAAPGAKPGPLVEAVTGKYAGKIGIPVTVVPGDLAPTEIERLG